MGDIADCDMECEEIFTRESEFGEGIPNEQNVFAIRPATPLNISGISPQQEDIRPETPPNNVSVNGDDFFRTPGPVNHDSFIRRIGLGRLSMGSSGVMPRMTSTPLPEEEKHSITLPSSSIRIPPNLANLRNIRQCRSAGSVKRSKVGPNGIPYKYINPFTPDGKLLDSKLKVQKKFKRTSLDGPPPKCSLYDSSETDTQAIPSTSGPSQPAQLEQASTVQHTAAQHTVVSPEGQQSVVPVDLDFDVPRRARLREFNVTRFNEEFIQMEEIGKGVHGCVYKCLNRINGCYYAIKKTLKPIKSGIQERTIRNEIYAHGVLSHQNIVRNFSCWKESGFVYIQNEYCNGGNLESYIESNHMSEIMLRNLLLQIASALKYMHKIGLAHMDIKPANIFITIEQTKESSLDSDGGYSDGEKSDEITFKLGDFGHVSKLNEDDAEEGDCRYISREIIEETYTHLDRADIFALGLTVYEAAGGGPLPKNGEEWHEIRNGKLRYLNSYTMEFNGILKTMIDPSPLKRPSPSDLVDMLAPTPPSPSPEDIATYIQQYRRNSTRLEHTALATNQYLKVLAQSHRQIEQLYKEKAATPPKDKVSSGGRKRGSVTKSRAVGRKTQRSSSTTLF